jgi:osmotically inducible protein OsmC
MELTVKGVVNGINNSKFEEIAKTAEASCPISNAIRNNVEIKLNATLAHE